MFLVSLLILSAFVRWSEGQCFEVSREDWDADDAVQTDEMSDITMVIIHHTEGAACNNQADCCQQVKNIQDYHQNTKGWWDIAYNFLVGEDGQVYEGRGWDVQGAHARPCNNGSIGIAVMGSFNETAPNNGALQRLQSFIACALANGKFADGEYTLHGHRDVAATDCPGDALYNIIQGWPNYSDDPDC